MNNVNLIVEKILDDADAKKQNMIEQALGESDKIEAEYDKQIAELKKQAVLKNDDMLYKTEKRTLVAANLESRNSLLNEKQTLIDRVFENVINRIHQLPKTEKQSLLVRLASNAVETGKEELIFDSEYFDEFGKSVVEDTNKLLLSEKKEASLKLSKETRPLGLGFIVKDENTETNCSLEKLILGYRDVLDSQIAEILFADIDAGDLDE